MALVDWEAVVLDIEGHLRSKNSHGQREMLDLLADLRVRHRQVEGLPEKALRLFGPELQEVISTPARREPVGSPAMDEGSDHRSDSTNPEENASAHRTAVTV